MDAPTAPRKELVGIVLVTYKIMYGRLPLEYMRHHVTGINQCPGCECEDETIQHLFQCQNQQMKDKRN